MMDDQIMEVVRHGGKVEVRFCSMRVATSCDVRNLRIQSNSPPPKSVVAVHRWSATACGAMLPQRLGFRTRATPTWRDC
jgi:hypothetical protein